jgi:energy-coupling factor transporter transmembrane protein EcfT
LNRPIEFGLIGILILAIWAMGRLNLRKGLASLRSVGWFLLGIMIFSGLFSPGPKLLGILSLSGLKAGGDTALKLLSAFLLSYLFSQILSTRDFVAGVVGILRFFGLEGRRVALSLELTLSSISGFTNRLRSGPYRFWELPDRIARMLREPPEVQDSSPLDDSPSGLVWPPILFAGAVSIFLFFY